VKWDLKFYKINHEKRLKTFKIHSRSGLVDR